MAQTFLITGGCGFVGRHLVAKILRDGGSVWIIDNLFTGKHPDTWLGAEWVRTEGEKGLVYSHNQQQVVFINADVATYLDNLVVKGLADFFPHFDTVFHLASIVGGRALIDGDPLLVSKDLAIDACFFLWVSRFPKAFDRVLYASSSAAYPIHLQSKEKTLALKEEFIAFDERLGQPDMTYGWSKLTGEFLAQLAHKRYGISIACVRPFSGYGEDQDLTYPVPSIARRVARHEAPIEVWGSGEQGRDFVHIDDCVDAFFAILDTVHDGRGINIGSGVLTSFNELIRLLGKAEGIEVVIKPLLDKPVGVQSRYADTTILNNEIGWKPSISLEDGMKRVLLHQHTLLSQ